MQLVDFILHIDVHLGELLSTYGIWVYAILFAILFLETGLVVTPFLPGDSLIFAAGAFAATGHLNIVVMLILLPIAAVAGDASNYLIGKYFGTRLLERDHERFIKKKHLDDTHAFFDRHGGKTIIFARFVPFVRTFAPFVAGIGHMSYAHFAAYNVVGGFLWTWLFLVVGYFFGNIPIVRDNFSLVIMAFIFISLVPLMVGAVKKKMAPSQSEDSSSNDTSIEENK